MMNCKIIAIYSIKNVQDQKRYIGQTINFNRRKSAHFSKLKKNYHGNAHLQAIFNKYGPDIFEIEILETLEDVESLNDRENYWIEHYNTINEGYNMCTGGSSLRIFSEEVRKKMSSTAKNLNRKYENSPNSQKIYQYDLDGNFIKEWSSTSEVLHKTEFKTRSSMWCCLNGATQTYKNFMWKREYLGIKIDGYKKINHRARRVAIFDLNSNELIKIFDSIAQACSFTKGNYVGIYRAASAPQTKYLNYFWKYV